MQGVSKLSDNRIKNEADTLGCFVVDYFEKKIMPRQMQCQKLQEIFEKAVPEHLLEHCLISEFADGELVINVESPSYAHELRLLKNELIENFQTVLGTGNIRKIRVIPQKKDKS